MNAATMRRSVVALLTTMLAVWTILVLPHAAEAAPRVDPDAVTSIEIHKLEQPDTLGGEATGLPQDISGLEPVGGATFTAQRVPEVDLTTTQGQPEAGKLTIAEAATKVAEQAITATGTTDAHGNTVLGPLEVGLYYVQESHTPAGYVAAAPFLVALPLTHPTEEDAWLHTVHVYPKNAKTTISLEVSDQDAVSLGDVVHWTSSSSIPNVSAIDGYRVEHAIDKNLEIIEDLKNFAVSVAGPDGPNLVPGEDFTVDYLPDDRILVIDFLTSGLKKLQETIAQDQHARVHIGYDTIVLTEGEHVNRAVLYPSQQAIAQRSGIDDTAVTRWGPISVLVHELDNPARPIVGARFRLYQSAADAAAQTNPRAINGVQEWETDAHGRLIVNGLRFSDFVNGLDRDTKDPAHRLYWFVATYIPEGWQWVDATPQAGVVNAVTEYQTRTFLVIRDQGSGTPSQTAPALPAGAEPTERPPHPAQDLSSTGAQILGAVILAGVLIATGIVLRSRRRSSRQGANRL